ncbi:MAG: hypothetical protein IPG07_11320 [Crocinitomicaceae bacterium]|nr:hypothetical protein [Crocinitomicaceae bacterium]
MTHNTFHQNTAPALFERAIYSNFAFNTITLRNNAISLNGTGDGQFAGIMASYSSVGGNVYRKMSATDNIPWVFHPQDDAINHLI